MLKHESFLTFFFVYYNLCKNVHRILKEPIEVVSMERDEFGYISCLVKWKHAKEPEKVDVEYIKENFPQLIIKYYEKIIVWQDNLV